MNSSITMSSKLRAMLRPKMAMIGERSIPNPPSLSIGIRLLIGHNIGLVTARTAS